MDGVVIKVLFAVGIMMKNQLVVKVEAVDKVVETFHLEALKLTIIVIVIMIWVDTKIIENKKKGNEPKNDLDKIKKINRLKRDCRQWEMKIEKEMH